MQVIDAGVSFVVRVCVCCVGGAGDGVSVSVVCMSAFTVNVCSSCRVSASVGTSGSHESSVSACGSSVWCVRQVVDIVPVLLNIVLVSDVSVVETVTDACCAAIVCFRCVGARGGCVCSDVSGVGGRVTNVFGGVVNGVRVDSVGLSVGVGRQVILVVSVTDILLPYCQVFSFLVRHL